jgi:hypothetical protein
MDSTKPTKPGTIAIEIRPQHWEPSGDYGNPRGRLLATMKINGQSFHVEAYHVRKNRDGEQCIADPHFQEEWNGMGALQNHDGGPFTTQRIGRREYVIVISPFLN